MTTDVEILEERLPAEKLWGGRTLDPVLLLVDERQRVLCALDELDRAGKSETEEFQRLSRRDEALLIEISHAKPTDRLAALAMMATADVLAELARDCAMEIVQSERDWAAYRRCFYTAMSFLATVNERARIGLMAHLDPIACLAPATNERHIEGNRFY